MCLTFLKIYEEKIRHLTDERKIKKNLETAFENQFKKGFNSTLETHSSERFFGGCKVIDN